MLELAGERWKAELGGDGADDYRFEIGGPNAGAIERGGAGGSGDIDQRLAAGHHVALRDSGARAHPFVGGIEIRASS